MMNLFKAELFKLKKSKSLKICTLILLLFVPASYGMYYLMSSMMEVAVGSVTLSAELTEELELLEGVNLWESLGILDMARDLFGDVAMILTAVFAVIFVTGEYGRGAVKNFVGKGYPRRKLFLAKLLVTVFATTGMLVLMELVMLLFGLLFKGTAAFAGTFWADFWRYSALQLLLAAAFTGVVILICELFRSMGAGMAVSICLIAFSSLLFSTLDLLLNKLDVRASDYWLVSLITECPTTDIGSSFAVRAVVLAAVWMVAACAVGIWHFTKADIK